MPAGLIITYTLGAITTAALLTYGLSISLALAGDTMNLPTALLITLAALVWPITITAGIILLTTT